MFEGICYSWEVESFYVEWSIKKTTVSLLLNGERSKSKSSPWYHNSSIWVPENDEQKDKISSLFLSFRKIDQCSYKDKHSIIHENIFFLRWKRCFKSIGSGVYVLIFIWKQSTFIWISKIKTWAVERSPSQTKNSFIRTLCDDRIDQPWSLDGFSVKKIKNSEVIYWLYYWQTVMFIFFS